MKSSLFAMFVLVTAVVAALSVRGYEEQPRQGVGTDPQNAIEPRSAPGEGQKFLAKLAGNWSVVKKFYGRDGQANATNGDCKQTLVQGGRFLQSDFTFHEASGDTTGMGLIGYDAEQGVFTSFWIDSRSTRISLRQSKKDEKFNGEKIVLMSKSLAEEGPAARQSRTETHLEDNGRTLVHQQFGLSPDGSERLVMELRMTRK